MADIREVVQLERCRYVRWEALSLARDRCRTRTEGARFGQQRSESCREPEIPQDLF